MIEIIICEKQKRRREWLEKWIPRLILIEKFEMKIVLSVNEGSEVITYIQKNPLKPRLIFWGIEENEDVHSLEAAIAVRKLDDGFSKLVFLASNPCFLRKSYDYKLEAMDFITETEKERLKKGVHECIRVANQRFKQINLFRGTVQLIEKHQIRTVDLSEILYLESSDIPHKIVIHRATEYFEIYGTLRDFEKEFEILCRCHQSFLVNLNHIKQVSIKDRLVRMSNEDICLVSVRGMKQLKLKLIERNIKYK